MRPALSRALDLHPPGQLQPIWRAGRQRASTVVLAEQIEHSIGEANRAFANATVIPLLLPRLQVKASPSVAVVSVDVTVVDDVPAVMAVHLLGRPRLRCAAVGLELH